MLYQEIDQELLPPPPKKTKSLGEELLPPPPKKKENLGLNELPTPSGNGLSSTPKVEEVVPVGQLPQVKKTLEDFGIKAPVIPKEQQVNQPVSTEAVQPKITASYDDFVAHNEERKVKHSKLVDEAIENSAKKVLKNKGVIKPEEEGKALNISQFAQLSTEKQRLQEALDNGDATFAIGKDGELGLKKTIGFWDALTKGWNQATKANDEAAEFANTDAAGKLAILKKQQEEAPPSEYLGERPSGVGSIGQLAGENAPFLGKAIAASAAGSALVLAAPETAGASLAGLPAAMAFAFTANDSKNQGIQSEVTRRFYQLKQENPEADEVELMKQAEEGTLMGGMAGILTNAALMSSVKTPLSNLAKGVVWKSITKAVGNAVYGGAATAAIEGAKLAEGNLEGIKATPTEIAKEMGHTFSETATTLGLLHVMTGAVTGALKLPNIVKSAFKYALKDAKPTEIQSTLKANVEAGTITPEAAEKVITDLDQYKLALSKTPNGLSPEAEASVAGLIQAKDKLIAEMKTKDDTAKPFYEEKIEGINGQIQKTVNTGKPYAHEIDEISGEKYTEQKEQPQPEVIEPSAEVKSEVLPSKLDVNSFSESQPNVRTEETRKLINAVAEIYGAEKYIGDFTDNYISKLQDMGELGHAVSQLLNSPKKAAELINDFAKKNVKSEPQPSTEIKSEEVKPKIKIKLSGKFTNTEVTNAAINEISQLGERNPLNDNQVVINGVKVIVERDGGKILLKEISSIEQGKGKGTGILKKIQEIAYKNGVDIVVYPTKIANTTESQLIKWYKDNGFEDYTQGGLIYKPKNIEVQNEFTTNLVPRTESNSSLEEIGDVGTSLKSEPQPSTVKSEEVNETPSENDPKLKGVIDDVNDNVLKLHNVLSKRQFAKEFEFDGVPKEGAERIKYLKYRNEYLDAVMTKLDLHEDAGKKDQWFDLMERAEDEYESNIEELKAAGEIKSETKPTQKTEEVKPEIKKLETERDTKIKELEKVEVPKLEYVKEDDLVKMKNETELIEEQRGIKKREAQLRKLIECLTK